MHELCYTNNPQSLFRKYKKLVTWFANKKIGREYLGLHFTEHIGLFLPNGYHKVLRLDKEKIIVEATFYNRARYAPKLYPALQVIDQFQQYFNSFDEVVTFLLWQLRLSSIIPDLAKQMHFNTLTSHPDASPENTSTDGSANRNVSNDTWADLHDGAGTSSQHTSGSTFMIALVSGTGTNQWSNMFRAFFLFDTSSIGSSATITGGGNTLQIWYVSKADTFGGSVSLVNSSPSVNTAISNGDYQNIGTTKQASDITVASITTGQYTSVTLNSTGDGSISQTGITKFGLRYATDVANSPPSWQSGITDTLSGNYADNGSNEPTLTVTYTLPGQGGDAGYSFFL